jgi:branched-chain amino acid transport system substrate-binding protein
MKKLTLISFVLLLVIGLVVGGCKSPTPTPTTEAKTLKLGGTMPLSGPASVAGLAFKQGYDMAVEKINNEGGIKIGSDTYMIEFITLDDKLSAEGSTTATNKLCYEDNVKFVFSSLAALTFDSMYKITREAGALMIVSLLGISESYQDSYGGVGPDKPLLIRLGIAHDEDNVAVIKYLTDTYPNVKTVAITTVDSPEYKNLDKKCASDWAPLGLEVSPVYELFAPDVVDFTPLMTRILTAKPDALYVYSAGPTHFLLIVKTAREMGFTGPIMFGPTLDPAYVCPAAPNLSDVICPGITMDSPDLPDALKEVVALGRAKYGKDFVADGIWAYDNLMVFTQLLEKAQSLDPQTALNTFEGLTAPDSLQSIFGPAHAGGIKSAGVNRILVSSTPVSRVNNGKGEFIGIFPKDIP